MRLVSGVFFAWFLIIAPATARAQVLAPYDAGNEEVAPVAATAPGPAQLPADPYQQPYGVAPQGWPSAPAPAYPAPQYPANPYYYPAPFYYQPVTNGPVYYPPAALGAQPAYPAFRRPPATRPACARCSSAPVAERARFFSIGGHLTSLSINQQIGASNVTLTGGGFELRFRNRGHFGLEASADFLRRGFELNGALSRESIPVQLSALIYIFSNSDARHFNIYFLGGLGIMGTTMGLVDENNASVKQSFTEYEAHLGAGLELRWNWFALRADLRGLALVRDNNSGAAVYYAGVDGGPVAAHSSGFQGTVGTAIWF